MKPFKLEDLRAIPIFEDSAEHGPLIDFDSAIAFLRQGATFAQKEGYRRYRKHLRKLEKRGLTGLPLRQEALLAAMRADGVDPPLVKVTRKVH